MKLFDRQKKQEINLYAYYDHAGIVRHLEDMARQGWQLEKAGSVFWTYRRCKPAELRYAVVYFPKASQFDPEPPAEQPCEAVELFATKTCPNCKQAEQLLDAADIRYTVRFAEENRDTVRALGIRQAPTLVSGGQKWTGVSGVREFIATKENANV